MAQIIATPTHGKNLVAGDLFSTVGPSYWDNWGGSGGVGERCYIRTNNPYKPDDADTPVFKLTVVRD